MEKIDLEDIELKKSLLKDFNHRLNNDLQALLAFIQLQKRIGVSDDEIINSSCVSISSISAIQNLMYRSDNDKNLIYINEFCKEFSKILPNYYANIRFSYEIENDFYMRPKKVFHLMFLINEMINMSIDFSFGDSSDNKVTFSLEEMGEECLLVYSDNGSGLNEAISGSNLRSMLFQQLIKQLDGNLESSDENSFTIKFKNDL